MAKYNEITRGQVELYMMQLGAREVDMGPRVKELVFERSIITSSGVEHPYKLRIYTSIDSRNDTCRAKGKDAIRVHLVDAAGKYVKGATRVNRIGPEVMDRVMDRCRELFKYAIDSANKCPKCETGLLVFRKPNRNAKWKAFKGCHIYPYCKGSGKA